MLDRPCPLLPSSLTRPSLTALVSLGEQALGGEGPYGSSLNSRGGIHLISSQSAINIKLFSQACDSATGRVSVRSRRRSLRRSGNHVSVKPASLRCIPAARPFAPVRRGSSRACSQFVQRGGFPNPPRGLAERRLADWEIRQPTLREH